MSERVIQNKVDLEKKKLLCRKEKVRLTVERKRKECVGDIGQKLDRINY